VSASPETAVSAELPNSSPETPPQASTPGGKSQGQVKPYDFRRPSFLSPRELRKLRQRHEEFASALCARLSIYLRIEFNLQISDLQPISYQAFTESLPERTHLCLFKMEPLRGIGVLEVHPRLGMTIIDRLLGGPAQPFNPERDFSEIELALLNQALMIILSEWSSNWAGMIDLHPSLLGHESNARFLQIAPHDTPMLVLSMEARIGECLEQIQLAIPGYTLEPLLRKMNGGIDAPATPHAPNGAAPAAWNPQYDDVRVPLCVAWNDLELTAREITQLKTGDFLALDPQCAQRIAIRLSDQARFMGRLGTANGCWAVEITESLK